MRFGLWSPRAALSGTAFALLLRYSAAVLILTTLMRCILAYSHADRVGGVSTLFELLRIGVRVDLITLGWALAVPVLLLPMTSSAAGLRLWTSFSRVYLAIALAIALFFEVASPGFLAEYEVRPNRLFLEYLEHPKEVVPMLWGGFRVSFLAGIASIVVGTWVCVRFMRRARSVRPLGLAITVVLWITAVAVCGAMIRSSFGHRPANPALFARWDDTLLNQIALNGAYTLAYAAYALKHEADVDEIYGAFGEQQFREALALDARYAGADPATPTMRWQTPSRPRSGSRPMNLIIVVEESLGAGFSAKLGGANLTPRLDSWSDRGWWFEDLYATGTRSARGLEAIVAGFPPSPAESVLKRDLSQKGFATLASVLRTVGYHSEFIYGGESHFDNMRGFFLGNGFHTVIDQDDYKKVVFRGSWGVSDEDLFARAHARAEEQYASGQPFFSLVFTSSNHTPFQFPEGRIDVGTGDPNTVENAVRYADYAVGQFLDHATRAPYFADTIVLVVADHDVRVYGDDVVPLERFRIPGLLIGPNIEPRIIRSIASQIDLAPTLLSVMGIEAQIPFPGRDLTRTLPEFGATDFPAPRAFMQFNDVFARLEAGELMVLLPGGEARRYGVDAQTQALTPLDPPSAADHRALLFDVHLPARLYAKEAYRSAPLNPRKPLTQ